MKATKVGCFGNPVTCVNFLDNGDVLYGLGPFLVKESRQSRQAKEVLALDGENLHGVRHRKHLSVVFGGSCVSMIDHRTMTFVEGSRYRTSDWIFDVQWKDDDTLLVGHAHNSIQVYQVERSNSQIRLRLERTLRGESRSINYSMHIGSHGEVAVGTVTNDILVWRLDLDETNASSRVESKLQGHQGVIHHVQWNDQGNYLISASDDRSCRCWIRQESEWSLAWSGYGHRARCWRAVFCEDVVISLSEDGSLRIWDVDDGHLKACVSIQDSLCLWSIDVSGSIAAVGTHSGTVVMIHWKSEVYVRRRRVFSVPDDRPAAVDPTNDSPSLVTKKRKKKVEKQVLVGSQLCVSPNGAMSAVVATRGGSVFELTLDNGSWRSISAWNNVNGTTIDPKLGTCMSLNQHASNCMMAIGCHDGNAIVHYDSGDLTTRNSIILDGTSYRSVQKLVWLNSSTLLVFSIAAVRIWKLSIGNAQPATLIASYRTSGGLAISYAFSSASRILLIGDTRGRVALYRVPDHDEAPATAEDIEPVSVAQRVHGKEHVLDLCFIRPDYVLSVGNDGSLCFLLLEGDQLRVANRMPVPSLTACCRIWILESQDIVIGGYSGDIYKLVSLTSLAEICSSIDTDGRARATHSVLNLASDSFALIVRIQLGDGRCELFFAERSIHGVLGHRLHNETIFGCSSFRATKEITNLLTVSEDCYARLSYVLGGCVKGGFAFGHIDSGARAVCNLPTSSRHYGPGTFVAIAGGKETIKCYFILDTWEQSSVPVVILLAEVSSGSSRTGQRINCLDVRQCPTGVILAAGDSAGQVSLSMVDLDADKLVLCPRVVARVESSIVSLLFRDDNLLLAGATSGKLICLEYCMTFSTSAELIEGSSLVTHAVQYARPHGGGLNAILDVRGSLITAGGDQNLMLVDHEFTNGKLAPLYQTYSSVRGGCLAGDQVVCADYAQRVYIIDGDNHTLLDTKMTEIGDINAICSDGNFAFVAGYGVAVLALE